MTVFTVTYTDGEIEEFRGPTQDAVRPEGVFIMGWSDTTITIPLSAIRKIEAYEES